MAERPQENSDLGSINEDQQLICSICQKFLPKTDLYSCVTCTESSLTQSDELLVKNERFCEICIVGIHLRKKHEVTDFNGNKPIVCETHETLCLLFCETCCEVFCFLCVGKHSRHRFLPVSEKACQVRLSIFDLLTQHEELAKPIKHCEFVVKESSSHIWKVCSSLSVENITETLCEVFQTVVTSNPSIWQKIVEEPFEHESSILCYERKYGIQKIVREADSSIQQLRSFLGMSDGLCIREFLAAGDKFKYSVAEQKDAVEDHHFLKWSSSDLPNVVLRTIKNALENALVPELGKLTVVNLSLKPENVLIPVKNLDWSEIDQSSEEFKKSVFDGFDDVFDVEICGNCVSFKILVERKQEFMKKRALPSKLACREYAFNISSVVSIFRKAAFVAFYLNTCSVFVFSLRTDKFVDQFILDKHLEPLRFFGSLSDGFRFTVWNSSKQQIEIDHKDISDNKRSIPCKTRPTFLICLESLIVFGEDHIWLRVHNCETSLHFTVSQVHHGLSRIDNLVLEKEENYLWLFEYKTAKMLKVQLSCSSVADMCWKVEKSYRSKCSLSNQDIRFMGKVQCSVFTFSHNDFHSISL